MSKQHTEDLKKIMSIEEEMIRLLPHLEDKSGLLNPWASQLSGIFRGFRIKSNQVILDIPCGKGGVSVPLAKKYGAKVIGYDIVKEYIEYANALAKKKGVSYRCAFRVEDIRKIIKRKNICDILLWVAPPHLWKTSKETIKALRNCVKNGGLILIADAYLYKPTKKYENYENLDSTNEGYTAFGDIITRFIDYKGMLWKQDYNRTKKIAIQTLHRIKDSHDKMIIKRYLKSLDRDEVSDTKYMGCGIWIIRVNK